MPQMMKLYHLSPIEMGGQVLKPAVPDNFMTRHHYENWFTKRVCFAPSIDYALRALSKKCSGLKLYVHCPVSNHKIIEPDVSMVPDVNVTHEVWICHPVQLWCIGQIEVIGDRGEEGLPYKFGEDIAYLYDWDWKWVYKNR